MKPSQKAILLFIHQLETEHGKAFPRIATIATETRYSRSAVKLALGALKDTGLLQIKRRKARNGARVANEYALTEPGIAALNKALLPSKRVATPGQFSEAAETPPLTASDRGGGSESDRGVGHFSEGTLAPSGTGSDRGARSESDPLNRGVDIETPPPATQEAEAPNGAPPIMQKGMHPFLAAFIADSKQREKNPVVAAAENLGLYKQRPVN